MRRFLLILTFLMVPFLSVAEEKSAAPRKKVGVVLSGGGAKGVAHVGVLKVLEEAGIPIDYVAGTSMGSIVGGMYSIGYTPAEMDSLFRAQNWGDLLGDRVSRSNKLYAERITADKFLIEVPYSRKEGIKVPAGILAGQNVLNMLNELTIGYHNVASFDDLPIPFACVAYDIVTGNEYVARGGSLPTAIRASMAIPGAFTPVELDSMLLVDGGVKNNFPVDVVLDMGADIVIGVDVGSQSPSYEELKTATGLLDQILTLSAGEKWAANRPNVDLYIRPVTDPYGTASFNTAAIDTLIQRGEAKAREQYDEILALKKLIGIEEDYVPEGVNAPSKEDAAFYVGDVVFDGLTGQQSSYMMSYLGITPHSIVTRQRLNDIVAKMRGSGSFSYVTYTLDNQPPYNLTIYVTERERASFSVGFRFDSEELASILLDTSIASVKGNVYSPKAGITARLSGNPYVNLYFDTGRRFLLSNLHMSYMFSHNDFTIYKDGNKSHTTTFNRNRIEAAFSNIYLRNFNASLGVQYEHYNYDEFLYVDNNYFVPINEHKFLNYKFALHYESFDDAFYPNRGTSLMADYTLYTDNGVEYEDEPPFGALQYSLEWAKALGDRVTLIPALYGRTVFGDNVAYPYLNYMGGRYAGRYMQQQLPFVGVGNVEIFDNSVMVGRLNLRTRLWKYHYVSLKANYAISNNNFFEMFDFKNDLFGYGLEYSYRTPVGPLMLEVDCVGKKFGGVYLGFGKFF
ncbi:MAG: patatin-like phospholipase family protein [Tidjanibacter sp.]|nr:patatin-like phospholipase family protein [Tidjanibacter sp.]